MVVVHLVKGNNPRLSRPSYLN